MVSCILFYSIQSSQSPHLIPSPPMLLKPYYSILGRKNHLFFKDYRCLLAIPATNSTNHNCSPLEQAPLTNSDKTQTTKLSSSRTRTHVACQPPTAASSIVSPPHTPAGSRSTSYKERERERERGTEMQTRGQYEAKMKVEAPGTTDEIEERVEDSGDHEGKNQCESLCRLSSVPEYHFNSLKSRRIWKKFVPK